MAWIVLVLSGLMETVWATALAQSDGFRNMRMIVVFLVAMVASMAGLGYALRELPVGTAYAVWTGIGAVGTALFGIAFLGEPARHGNRRHTMLERQFGGAPARQAGLNDDSVGPVSLHRGESALELLIVADPDRVDRGSGDFAAELDLFEERF